MNYFFTALGKFTEPIYENVPLSWNSKDIHSHAAGVQGVKVVQGVQTAPEIKPPSKVPQQVQPIMKDIIVEKPQIDVKPVKNNVLDMSNSSITSTPSTSTSVIHSAEQSFGK